METELLPGDTRGHFQAQINNIKEVITQLLNTINDLEERLTELEG